MDDIGKSRIRLSHWNDHNLEHLRGYAEVAAALDKHGLGQAAQAIREGMGLIEAANAKFRRALDLMPAVGDHTSESSQEGGGDHTHHHHHHEH